MIEPRTITTLDGKFWQLQDILQQMHDDSFYYDYLGQNALSSSACTKLLDSPLKYLKSLGGPSESSSALSVGSLFHYRILEPDKWKSLERNGRFLNVKGRNTKAYKDALSEYGEVYTSSEKRQAIEMSNTFLSNSRCMDMLNHTRQEVPAIGEIFGLPFRAKADILGDGYIVDLKSTAEVKSFRFSANKWNYDSQMYIYCTLFDIPYDCFTFVVVDKESYSLGIFECSKEFYLSGKNKVEMAVNIYRDYFIEQKRPPEEFYLYDVL